MWRKWRKGIVWLLAVMLVLGAVAGCGKSSGGSPERALGLEQEIGQSGQTGSERQEVSENREESGIGEDSENTEEAGIGEEPENTEEAGIGEDQGNTAESDEGEGQKDFDGTGQVRGKDVTKNENGSQTEEPDPAADGDSVQIEEDGTYISKDEVALYLHIYGHLPRNYITKKEAQERGWDSKKGNLDEAAPGMSIGGSYFGNYEGMLPEKKGRRYYECDLEYEGGYRGAKRLIYSNDGLIFYTEDHYKTFEQLY